MMLKNLLAHPLTRGINLDDPRTTHLRNLVIQEKPFLTKIYQEWYQMIAAWIPDGDGSILELGSGAGFMRQHVPELLASDVFICPKIDMVCDGQRLPFTQTSLRAIIMTDVLHHIPNVRLFLAEAQRCLRSGGRVIMIEPWVTSWSRFVYNVLHHEPFDPHALHWEFPSSGPLSGANDALPWIILNRDRAAYELEFPSLKITYLRMFMPFRYLVCGGISLRSLMPSRSFGLWRGFEKILTPFMKHLAMFALIVLQRD